MLIDEDSARDNPLPVQRAVNVLDARVHVSRKTVDETRDTGRLVQTVNQHCNCRRASSGVIVSLKIVSRWCMTALETMLRESSARLAHAGAEREEMNRKTRAQPYVQQEARRTAPNQCSAAASTCNGVRDRAATRQLEDEAQPQLCDSATEAHTVRVT